MSKYIDADVLMEEIRKAFYIKAGGTILVNIDDALNVINEMPAADVEPKERWISVDERLPEIEQDVSVAFDDGFVATACIEKDGDWGLWQDSGEVTHWQPLPEPPKMDGGSKE